MPYSEQDYETSSRICVPLNVQSTEIVRPASGELDIVRTRQDELPNDTKEKQHVIPSRNTKTMVTVTEYTSSGSPSCHSSMSLSSATSTSSALCDESDDIYLGTKDSCRRIHNAVLHPTRTNFTIGPREDDVMPDEGPSIPAPRRVVVEGKGKTPEQIQEIPISRSTNVTRCSKSTNGTNIEQKYSGRDNPTSEFHEIGEPSTYFLESSSTSSDGEDDGLADLSASVATIRPPDLTRTVTEPPESSSTLVVDDVSEPASRAASPHSDQSYTLEVRPPSSIMATPDGEDQDTYDDSPTIPQANSPQSRSTPSPALRSGLHTSRANSRRQVTMRVSSPPELFPVPPVASIRDRRPRPPSQDGSQSSGPSIRPPSLPDRRSAEYPRANHTSTSTARSPSLSPLAWETTPVAPGSTSLNFTSTTLGPVNYLTGSWPPDRPNTSAPNPLWSTPSNFRSVSTPALSHTYPQSGRSHFHFTEEEARSSPDSLVSVPVTGLSNPPSAPQRTTRFTVPLPPSPGSSLRTSAFNSPFPSVASTADSWGTPATLPRGESVYNQTTLIPGETAQWPDPQPSLPARNSTPTWFPESSANGHNLLWTSVDWPAWSDPTHIPQVSPIPTATPSPPYITPPGYLLICSYCGSPAPACVCRRYVRVAPVSTGTSGGLRTPRPPTMPHPTFWFPDGTIIFEVEDVFFKVHKYFFERHSEHFRNLLARRSAASNIVPVKIPDAKKLDFERLLKVFYPSNLANPELATVEEWTSVLTLAVKWHMDELISLSIQELTPITSAVDKISLAKKFGLFGYNLAPNSNYNRDWLLPALRELCGRNFPLRFEEARKLDM